MEACKSTEWLMTEYGLRQAYYNGKRRSCPGYCTVVIMKRWEGSSLTLQEVIERAQKLYPNLILKPVTGRKWTEKGLLPKPEIQHLGGTQGNRAHYPKDAPAQMAVAGHLMALGYTQKQIAQARQIVLEGAPVDSDLMRDVVSLLTLRQETSNEGTARLPSPEANELALAVQYYAKAIALARTGRPMDSLWPTYTHTQTDYDAEGNETFSYYVSLLGLYWDPRVDRERLEPLATDLNQRMKEQLDQIRWKRKHDN